MVKQQSIRMTELNETIRAAPKKMMWIMGAGVPVSNERNIESSIHSGPFWSISSWIINIASASPTYTRYWFVLFKKESHGECLMKPMRMSGELHPPPQLMARDGPVLIVIYIFLGQLSQLSRCSSRRVPKKNTPALCRRAINKRPTRNERNDKAILWRAPSH